MGTIQTGILGGFNGTVGTVVGSNWKGISTMRARARPVPLHVYRSTTIGAEQMTRSPIRGPSATSKAMTVAIRQTATAIEPSGSNVANTAAAAGL